MALGNVFKRLDRTKWYVCHTCLGNTNHNAELSIFYTEAQPVPVLGRPTMLCPRCKDTNTRSFKELKEDGSEAALWGLERIVRKNPRSKFEVNAGNGQLKAAI
jgi:hypothetical protein